jgi:hypothetical protein
MKPRPSIAALLAVILAQSLAGALAAEQVHRIG